jgi:ribosome recycling factor
LNPSTDGKVVRIPIPSLTEERRKELVKRGHHMAEESRTAIRQVRRDGNDKLKKMLRGHEISEDDEKRALDEIQKMTDKNIDEIASILNSKETDIMAV